MVDSALEPHLLEVNTKPQLLPLPLDRSVNSKSTFDDITSKQCDDLVNAGECANDLRNVAHSRLPYAPL